MIAPCKSFDDVVEEANRLPYGLAAYAYTRSAKTAQRMRCSRPKAHCRKSNRRTPLDDRADNRYLLTAKSTARWWGVAKW